MICAINIELGDLIKIVLPVLSLIFCLVGILHKNGMKKLNAIENNTKETAEDVAAIKQEHSNRLTRLDSEVGFLKTHHLECNKDRH